MRDSSSSRCRTCSSMKSSSRSSRSCSVSFLLGARPLGDTFSPLPKRRFSHIASAILSRPVPRGVLRQLPTKSLSYIARDIEVERSHPMTNPPTRPSVYKRRVEVQRMSASRSLPGSSQARASEQGRSSHRARRTESIGLAFGDTASFSPRKPWFSCSKARGSETHRRPRQRPRPIRRVRRMGTTPGRDSGACAGRVLLAGRFVRVTSANARRASSSAPSSLGCSGGGPSPYAPAKSARSCIAKARRSGRAFGGVE